MGLIKGIRVKLLGFWITIGKKKEAEIIDDAVDDLLELSQPYLVAALGKVGISEEIAKLALATIEQELDRIVEEQSE